MNGFELLAEGNMALPSLESSNGAVLIIILGSRWFFKTGGSVLLTEHGDRSRFLRLSYGVEERPSAATTTADSNVTCFLSHHVGERSQGLGNHCLVKGEIGLCIECLCFKM